MNTPDLEELERLLAKATPVKPSDLIAYDHGGGRLAVISDTERTLVADFYGDGTDRDFFMALHNAAPSLIAKAREADELRAEVERLTRELKVKSALADDHFRNAKRLAERFAAMNAGRLAALGEAK